MIPLIHAARFGARHGFTTRVGGVSQGPLESLNLGRSVGDDPRDLAENGARFLAATGATALACVQQVHGDRVLEVSEGRRDLAPLGEADALVTHIPDLALCIGTADCLPVLLRAPDTGGVGAAHAGWRGAMLRIGAKTAAALVDRGADPRAMRAALGPCIRACCYAVSPELAERFAAAFGEGVIDRGRAQPHLDIARASWIALVDAGLAPAHIEDLGLCTACDPDRFFSHRRDRGRTGRMLAFVASAPHP